MNKIEMEPPNKEGKRIKQNPKQKENNTSKKINNNLETNHNSYPKTRFFGSKRKQLSWLESKFKNLQGTTVLDAFGGTGTVSILFSQLGKYVTYNDTFRFQEVSAKALIGEHGAFKLANELINDFSKKVKPYTGFITNNFDNVFFTHNENKWLDGAMREINNIKDDTEQAVILHCLFQSCLQKRPYNLFHRANLNLRHSDKPVSFGNRTTWENSFENHMATAYKDIKKTRHLLKEPVTVLPYGPAESIENNYEIVYIDPPYFNANGATDSYLKRYHFLEGLSRFNEWPNLIDHDSKIKIMKDIAVPSEWRSKSEFKEKLFNLIEKHKRSTVILSYVTGAHPTQECIYEIFNKTFKKTTIHTKEYTRVLSKSTRTELLFIGEP